LNLFFIAFCSSFVFESICAEGRGHRTAPGPATNQALPCFCTAAALVASAVSASVSLHVATGDDADSRLTGERDMR
jgi:hypothetical protein